eukprot:gb/GECG01016502.1/.p1 GENE.gb/GECG01016502.1/~~gb/GECG01016502.1/.p1  ORF type:complete len:271 (+),score=43.92 gb/GECG01016502.1/:1-813(+)
MKSQISIQLLLVAGIALFLSAPGYLGASAQDTEADDDDIHVVEEGGTEDNFEEYYEDAVEDPLFEEGAEVYVKGGLAQAFDSKLPIGKQVSVLCGIINAEDEPIHMMGIAGTLNDPNDYSRVLMNFTGRFATNINESIPEDTEATYAHTFRMPKTVEPQKVTLSLQIFYVFNRMEYEQTFFNETVEFVSVEESVQPDILAKYIFTLVAAVVIAWLVYKIATGSSRQPATSGRAVKHVENYMDPQEQYLRSLEPSKKSKSKSSKGSDKKNT